LGWKVIDRDAFVDYQRRLVDVAPDVRGWADHVRTRGNVTITTGRAFGTQAGGPWEIAFVSIAVSEDDGRVRHFENYEIGDLAIAIARFDELAAAEDARRARAPVVDLFENAATRAARQHQAISNAEDWQAF